MAKGDFYAVAAGRSTGIFTTWAACEAQVKGFTGSKYKKFKTHDEAQAFVCEKKKTKKTEKSTSLQGFAGAQATADQDGPLTVTTTSFTLTENPSYAVAKKRKTRDWQTSEETTNHVKHLSSVSCEKVSSREQVGTLYATAATGQDDYLNPKDPTTLVAFCDGSALKNGRQKCRAGYACIFPHCEEWNVAKQLVEACATNNRAEFMAALEAMQRANAEDPDKSRLLYIFSDSMLLIRSMTEWVGIWQKNNWTKSDGKPVQNRDLLELLIAEKGSRCICWKHVKAHTGKNDWKSKWNDVADKAARNAASSVDEV
ncbi:unnamed protein product [Peronospora belbahrii]|uniref:ribonuclease H n=1 Tax=Peronospora belbahrii TaxID=622444 RepID=A0AAU9LRE4_9STRA|nr:unnamed protein product [Peronospora belbahrii]CAH0522565.1 unnamed protein product [Peronospora belbahrii]